jgi:DNA-binding NtrC family response regulator
MARILIVDDHEEERVYLWDLLKKEDHELFFASSGTAGFQTWAKKDPDLSIIELYIPNKNGLRLINEIMAEDPMARIIAFSNISADQLPMAEDLGACRILRKPVDPDEFIEVVNEALTGVRVRPRDWR